MSLPPLVDAAWLMAELGRPGLVVLDATYYLPAEARDPRALFAEAHIPGARFFDIDAIADRETDLPHMLPAAGAFARAVGALGVGPETDVVIYDQKGIFSAPRAWWSLRVFGHARAAVLDGGLPAWREAGGAIASGPAPVAPAAFVPEYTARLVRGLGDMRRVVEDGAALVLDARPAPRFTGAEPEPRPGLARGHMPGARSLPASELLEAGRLRTPAALRARFAAAGVDGTRPVVTTCGSGVTAAVVAFGLHLAGLGEAAVYDGSWAEWGARTDTPKALGDG